MKKNSASNPLSYTSLNYSSTYRCPACASGELNVIALMDVFACDFCRHMFTANLDTQSVQLADTVRSRIWHWNGWRWRTSQQRDTAAVMVWAFSAGLTIVPVTLIALSNYIFPPLEASNFPLMWIELTLVAHGVMAGWLLAEYHHWPWYISSRIRLKQLRERWFSS
ncbi:hypothetical protein IQ256_06630 [cf. Phormidesmis sp. LEGE 11477]|nr:hypothetical protein [cf. Phormidesmis sp. LEGE 11477]